MGIREEEGREDCTMCPLWLSRGSRPPRCNPSTYHILCNVGDIRGQPGRSFLGFIGISPHIFLQQIGILKLSTTDLWKVHIEVIWTVVKQQIINRTSHWNNKLNTFLYIVVQFRDLRQFHPSKLIYSNLICNEKMYRQGFITAIRIWV